MTALITIDLSTDPAALRVVKDEAVAVEFAASPGELVSLEGPNRYRPADAIITGATGERWVVSRERFDAKYVRAVEYVLNNFFDGDLAALFTTPRK